jgi:hypothetical protein
MTIMAKRKYTKADLDFPFGANVRPRAKKGTAKGKGKRTSTGGRRRGSSSFGS